MFQAEAHALAADGIASFTILAVVFNSFLIYVILRYTKSKMGIYKHMLVFYATFEIVFAIITYMLKPVKNYCSNKNTISSSIM